MTRILSILLLLIPIFAQSQTSEKNFIDQNYIEVSGKAEKEIVPDLIYLSIRISERDSKTKAPINQTEKSMISKLTDLGIDASADLVVRNLGSYQNALVFKTTIDLQKDYLLTTHSAKQAGQVMVELEKLGISNIRVSKIDHSKMEDYRNQVRILATQAARAKADAMAKALNQSIGRAIHIHESNQDPVFNYPANSREFRYLSAQQTGAVHRGFSEESESANVDFETIKIEYVIFIKFELK
jgi:uncharacterized protein